MRRRNPEDRKRAPRPERDSTVPSDSAEASWLDAYIACARGDFARALGIAKPLADTASDPGVRARAAVTAGSVLRQTARHAEARDIEARALRRSPPAERAHLLVGLAADAAGMGDVRECARRVVQAERALPPRDWRARVRLDWVRCELALLRKDPTAAARAARAALRRSVRAGALRHEAKSWLFLGVCLRETGAGDHRAALERAAELSRECGAREIRRVARALL